MATNKNALVRYKVLDKCFRNPGKKYTINDLIEECSKALTEIDPDSGGISRRQIYEDIAFMESAEGWSIDLLRVRENRRVYHRYSDLAFSINNMPLNETEVYQLQSAVDILSQFKGMPQFGWVNELIPRLSNTVGATPSSAAVISFDNNDYLKGIEYLEELYQAIRYRQVLKVLYHPYEETEPLTFLIHPYFLKQYNNRWFAFGYYPQKDKYDWNLALDRIVSIEVTDDQYLSNSVINWDEYFEDIIGVTKPYGKEVEEVVLHFNRKTARYIETKPIHGSQKSRWLNDDTLEIRLSLIINYEFERFVLSYADSVKVIKPETLAASIYLRSQNAASQYKGNLSIHN